MQPSSHPSVRAVMALLASLMLFASALAVAGTEPFDEARFAGLQSQGALILVDVHAHWCPTCAKQQAVLDAWEKANPDITLHRLLVDFDTQKEWVTHFRAPRQSTLILFKGREQRWFGVAETRPEAIDAAIRAAAAPR